MYRWGKKPVYIQQKWTTLFFSRYYYTDLSQLTHTNDTDMNDNTNNFTQIQQIQQTQSHEPAALVLEFGAIIIYNATNAVRSTYMWRHLVVPIFDLYMLIFSEIISKYKTFSRRIFLFLFNFFGLFFLNFR